MQLDNPYGDHGAMPDILLVEDNPLHVRLVKSMLADIWPEVEHLRHAKRLEDAVIAVKHTPPKCVLLDLILPDADGLEAARTLLAAAPHVPIVILSSHEDDELAIEAVKEGAQDYLVKGTIGPEALARAIQFAIERHHVVETPVAAPAAAEAPATALVANGEVAAGIAVVDASGSVLYAEPAVADMLCVGMDQLVGVPSNELVHPNDMDAWNGALASQGHEVVVRLRHASGNPLRVRIVLRPLSDAERPGAGYIAQYFPKIGAGTVSSGGVYAVMTGWS
jgi:DNA-binding NarL/FixJ family response regulator